MVEPWPDPHQLVGQKLSQYKITGYLGRGGMGYVYKGRQTSLERDVAIKMMLPHLASDPKFGARFRRESHAVANLDHPHIVQIYDFGQEGGMYYMVMPYIPGGTLKTYLEDFKARDARVPVDAIVRILTQVGSALQHAHENGVLHRDIKPGNVMLYSVNQVVLTDFGLAKIVGSDLSTSSSNPFGTIAYMAPEQFEDASSVDQRADIYALGITLYEMAAGRVPFEGSPVKVMNQHLKVQPPDLRQFRDDLPDVIIRLIEKALAKDPAKRFQTVRAMLDALKA
jgi:serine/threonine-protein kinase